jgi:acetyl esterase
VTLDEATATLVQALSTSGRKPTWESTPVEARAGGPLLTKMIGPGPQMHTVIDLLARATSREVPIRLLVPREEIQGLLIYLHGGGFVVGSLDEFDTLGRNLADASGWAVALVDYALAPEHPYPAALEDAWAALQRLADLNEVEYGGRLPLVVSGDSAGANLATVTARRAVTQGSPRLAGQVLVYPVTDAAMSTESYADPANQLLLRRESMEWFWGHYLPDGQDLADPDVSPLCAEELSGIAPALVITAEHDVLRDEGEAYAERLRAAGSLIDLKRLDGQMHGFFSMPNLLPASTIAVDLIASTLADLARRYTS